MDCCFVSVFIRACAVQSPPQTDWEIAGTHGLRETPEEKEFTQRMLIALEKEMAKPGHMAAELKALREAADAGNKLAADLLRQWARSPKLATLLGGN